MNVALRFWSNVSVGAPRECWLYTGPIGKAGYGVFTVKRKNFLAHRVAYALANGVLHLLPEEKVMHSCDNRKCCNPNHLFEGSQAENNADMVSKGRQAIGFALPHTKLSDDDVWTIIAAKGRETQRSLADRFGVSKGLISHYWTGRYRRNSSAPSA